MMSLNYLLISGLFVCHVKGFSFCLVYQHSSSKVLSLHSSLKGKDYDDKQTLYDVLESSPFATRDELKKHYVRLARDLHPDSHKNKLKNDQYFQFKDNNQLFPEKDFREVTAAWMVLKDPKKRRRYDRELRAREFVKGIFVPKSERQAKERENDHRKNPNPSNAAHSSAMISIQSTERILAKMNRELGATSNPMEKARIMSEAWEEITKIEREKIKT